VLCLLLTACGGSQPPAERTGRPAAGGEPASATAAETGSATPRETGHGLGSATAAATATPLPSPTAAVTPSATARETGTTKLDGVWGGFFPDHRPGEDRGVEIQFERADREAFVLREDGPENHETEMVTEGGSVRIHMTNVLVPDDQSVITGTLLDPATFQGRFVNESRHEDFAITLKRHPDSDEFRAPGPGRPGGMLGGPSGPTDDHRFPNGIAALRVTGVGTVRETERNMTGWTAGARIPLEWNLVVGYPGYFDGPQVKQWGTKYGGDFWITPLYWFGTSYSIFEFYDYQSSVEVAHYGKLYLDLDEWSRVGYEPMRLKGVDGASYYFFYYVCGRGCLGGERYFYVSDVTIQVVRQDPNLFFTTGREDYIAAWDPDAGKVRYSDRFPSVTELVAKYLANYGY
jgi:hypothetical protein